MMKKTSIWATVLIVSISLFMTGCGKIEEKVSEGIVEKAIGGNVDITKDGFKVEKDGVSVETGNDLKWPKRDMGDLPELKGKILGVLKGSVTEGCTVVMSEISIDAIKAYAEKLEGLGYKNGLGFSDTEGLGFSGKNSSGASVTIAYMASSKEGTIQYISAEGNKGN